MLKISPVGTCRIHTPFRRAEIKYDFELSKGGNYGFTHTSAEALQQIKFMRGEINIEDINQELTFRPSLSDDYLAEAHGSPDIYFIEISSAKHIAIDDKPVQMNYAYRYFSEFFADKERAVKFWSLCKHEKLDERNEWLLTEPSFARLNKSDQYLLDNMKMSFLGEKEIRAHLEQITDMVGSEKIILTTHVNALNPDGRTIKARSALIRQVVNIAQSLNLKCYDPSMLMHEFGQVDAMEDDGLDLTHYTPEFADYLFKDWDAEFFHLVPEGSAGASGVDMHNIKPLRMLKRMISAGDIIAPSKELHRALGLDESLHDYRRLLCRLQILLGDHEGAIANIQKIRETVGTNEEDEEILMHASYMTGKYDLAYDIGTSLLSDEVENDQILEICAMSAYERGDPHLALPHLQRMYYRGENVEQASSKIFKIMIETGDDKGVEKWAGKVFENMPRHEESLVLLWNMAVEEGDTESLIQLAENAHILSTEAALDMANKATDAGLPSMAGLMISNLGEVVGKSVQISAWVDERSVVWLEKGRNYLEDGDIEKASDYIQGSVMLDGNDREALRASRLLDQKFRIKSKEAYKERDFESIIRLAQVARRNKLEFSGLDALAGRAALELGDYSMAVSYLKAAINMPDVPERLYRLLVKAALKAESYDQALMAYNNLLLRDDIDETARLDLIERRARLKGRAIMQARAYLEQDEFRKAWGVLEAASSIDDPENKIANEKRKVLIKIRNLLRAKDPEDNEGKYMLAKLMISLDQNDPTGLKAAAVSAMRLHKFDEALEHWEKLLKQVDDNSSIKANIEKCKIYINRKQKAIRP